MERSGKQTFCCGAGGAHMWMEERGRPINEERAREAAETGAETLAVACPFCTVMLDDGVRERGDELRVVDVVDAARGVARGGLGPAALARASPSSARRRQRSVRATSLNVYRWKPATRADGSVAHDSSSRTRPPGVKRRPTSRDTQPRL